MENTVQTRVLAYTMAKEITESELQDVSGGGFSWCHHGTLYASGGGINDTMIDFSIDGRF